MLSCSSRALSVGDWPNLETAADILFYNKIIRIMTFGEILNLTIKCKFKKTNDLVGGRPVLCINILSS